MKQHKLLVLVFIILTVLLCGCDSKSYQQMLDSSPERQPGTYWSNEEKNFLFQVNNKLKKTGVIYTGADVVDTHIYLVARAGWFDAYYDEDDTDPIEEWNFTVISDSEFTATVEKTAYFHEGDEFTFHKISREEYEEALKSMGALDDFIKMLGETAGQAYRNERFNLTAAFDEGWHIYTEDELNESRGYSLDELSKLLEARRSPAGVSAFCAKAADGTASVSVTIQKNAGENAAQTEAEYATVSQQNMPETFEGAGMRCESTEVVSLEFAGSTHPAVTVHATYNGIDLYETLVPVKQGDYYAVIAATCLGQDNTMSALDAFQAIAPRE